MRLTNNDCAVLSFIHSNHPTLSELGGDSGHLVPLGNLCHRLLIRPDMLLKEVGLALETNHVHPVEWIL